METTSTDRIEKQIELNAPVARVWRALTDYKEFSAWFKVDLESPFVPGETTRGQITHPGCEHMVMQVVVKEMEAQHLFSYDWKPGVVDPNADNSNEPSTLVEFKLEATDGGTMLYLTESGFDALPAERREELFRRNEGGWTGQMKNIETHVTKNP